MCAQPWTGLQSDVFWSESPHVRAQGQGSRAVLGWFHFIYHLEAWWCLSGCRPWGWPAAWGSWVRSVRVSHGLALHCRWERSGAPSPGAGAKCATRRSLSGDPRETGKPGKRGHRGPAWTSGPVTSLLPMKRGQACFGGGGDVHRATPASVHGAERVSHWRPGVTGIPSRRRSPSSRSAAGGAHGRMCQKPPRRGPGLPQ